MTVIRLPDKRITSSHAASIRALAALRMPTKVDQTIVVRDGERRVGNCFAACVATALGLHLDEVPHFMEWGINHYGDTLAQGSHWHAMFLGFLAGRGLWPQPIESPAAADPEEVVFVSGMSPRGVPHQVLFRAGVLWHDPHPSRAGLTTVWADDVWVIRLGTPHDHTPTA